jgi:hypothetical protein
MPQGYITGFKDLPLDPKKSIWPDGTRPGGNLNEKGRGKNSYVISKDGETARVVPVMPDDEVLAEYHPEILLPTIRKSGSSRKKKSKKKKSKKTKKKKPKKTRKRKRRSRKLMKGGVWMNPRILKRLKPPPAVVPAQPAVPPPAPPAPPAPPPEVVQLPSDPPLPNPLSPNLPPQFSPPVFK